MKNKKFFKTPALLGGIVVLVLVSVVGVVLNYSFFEKQYVVLTMNDYSVKPEKNSEVEEVIDPLLKDSVSASGMSFSFRKDSYDIPSAFLLDGKVSFGGEEMCSQEYVFIDFVEGFDEKFSVYVVSQNFGAETYSSFEVEEYLFYRSEEAARSEKKDYSRGGQRGGSGDAFFGGLSEEKRQQIELWEDALVEYSEPRKVGGQSLPFIVPPYIKQFSPDLDDWYYVVGKGSSFVPFTSWSLGGDSVFPFNFSERFERDMFFCNVRFLPYYTDVVKVEENGLGLKKTTLAFNQEKFRSFNGWYSVEGRKKMGVGEEDLEAALLLFDNRLIPFDSGVGHPLDLLGNQRASLYGEPYDYNDLTYTVEEISSGEWIVSYYDSMGELAFKYFWVVE